MRFPASSEADVDLLVPIAELGALQIILQRLLAFAAILVALRQIERVARDQERIGLGRERALEDRRVVLVLPRIFDCARRRCCARMANPVTVSRERMPGGASRYSCSTPLNENGSRLRKSCGR